MGWSEVKFGMEDIETQVRQLRDDAGKLRDRDDPDEENVWMGDILSHLDLLGEEARSAYAKTLVL